MTAIAATTGSVGGPMMMSGASSRMPASTKMSSLFDQIDASGSGSITQSQFDQAFQTLRRRLVATRPVRRRLGVKAGLRLDDDQYDETDAW
jgi:hypothetical protein